MLVWVSILGGAFNPDVNTVRRATLPHISWRCRSQPKRHLDADVRRTIPERLTFHIQDLCKLAAFAAIALSGCEKSFAICFGDESNFANVREDSQSITSDETERAVGILIGIVLTRQTISFLCRLADGFESFEDSCIASLETSTSSSRRKPSQNG